MLRFVRPGLFVWLLLSTVYAPLAAAQILNSERIEQTFGSYGIDVLYSDERLRLSSLYSEHDGEKNTRTLAVVEYPEFVDEAFAVEHRVILDGGSIGSTFTAAGWEVNKRNLSILEVDAADEFAGRMGIAPRVKIATHFYRLDIEKNGQHYPYASIVEMHHPEYLSTADLSSIYPLDIVPASENPAEFLQQSEDSVRRHLGLAYSGLLILREAGLTLSQ